MSRGDLSTCPGRALGADGVKLTDVDGDGRLDIVTVWEEAGVVKQWIFAVPLQVDGRHGVDIVAAGKDTARRRGRAIARRHPGATIVALDWPQVLEVAHENAVAAGVADRQELLAGDAFEIEFGSGYDAVLVTNLYHHFDVAQCEALARTVHASLAPGGRAYTLEFVPNVDRVTPPIPASFALMMLGATPAGDAYPFSVYDAVFRTAGFSHNELHQVPQSPQQLIVSVRD